ncbi:MAG: PspC domain-containing protein [Chloroflexi bacterium]|nr:PspC domain-containing protein [Chloroflexota bacterium]
MNRRRLYRCNHDRKVAGVASGLAEYLDIDVSLIRILWIVSIFFGGLGLLLYIVMALVVPMEPYAGYQPGMVGEPVPGSTDPATGETVAAQPAPAADWHGAAPAGHRHVSGGGPGGGGGGGLGLTFLGIVLVLGGSLALIDTVLPGWADGRFVWPAFILGLGVLLIATAMQRRQSQP